MPEKPAEYLTTKVTTIDGRYHCRLIDTRTDTIIDEMACENQLSVGWCCAEMLRWHDKLGGQSDMATAARRRMGRKGSKPVGRIWYCGELP